MERATPLTRAERIDQQRQEEAPPQAPFWARAAVVVAEVLLWLLTFGTVKRIRALESLLHYFPHWRKRDYAEESIKGALRSGMGAARRLAMPLLRIETEFLTESSGGDAGYVLTPRTATAYEETLKTRMKVNARIRSYLRDLPVDDLQAPFLVNACTWNVDQQPPPVYEDAFLAWLIGQELTDEVKHYQAHKQAVLAYGGEVSKPFSPTGSSTMRRRKANASTSSTDDSCTHRRATTDDFRFTDQKTAAVALESEWKWLEAKFPDLLLVSLQEVEMTGAALVRESTQRSWEWTDAIIETLAAASDRAIEYKKVQVVQLVGLVLIVLVQAKHVDYVSHVRLSLTRTGALSVLGNKGSVAMRVTIYGKRFLIVSAHFVAHKYNEKRRTSNYQAALKDIRFDMPVWSDDESEVLQTFMSAKEVQNTSIDNSSVQGNSAWERLFRFGHSAFRPSFTTAAEKRVLDDHDYVFFIGDLNSRLHALPGPSIKESATRGEYDYLLCHDEVRQLMVSGEAFDGFQEQWIAFPPTYKYDRGTDSYDTSRKRRDPAWCDRILFRVLESAPVAPLADVGGVDSADSDSGLGSLSPDGQGSSSLGRSDARSGVWVSLEELQGEALAPEATSAGAAARAGSAHPSSSSSSASSSLTEPGEGPRRQRSFSRELENSAAAMAAVAKQNGVDSPEHLARRYPQQQQSSPARVPTHAVWERRSCAPTFCAARRPRRASSFADKDDQEAPARFPMITNHVNPLEYTYVPNLRQSDHRPVRARFEVKVVAMEPALVSDIVDEVRHLINS